MKNIAFTTIFLIFLIASINAQENAATLPEFGKVSVDELRLKDCIFAPEASAINLLKYKEVELSVFPNGTTEVVTRTRYRTKVFNRNGYKNATITFPFYGDNTIKTKNIQAATFNVGADGNVSITKVKDEDIFKDKGTKKEGRRSISFTFPDLREGSVIECQIVRKYKMAYDVPSWYFKDDIPNALTVYKVIRQPLSNLVKRVVSNMPVEETDQVDESKGPDKKQLQDIHIVRNVPAFESEVFMSSSRDYKYRIDLPAKIDDERSVGKEHTYSGTRIKKNKKSRITKKR